MKRMMQINQIKYTYYHFMSGEIYLGCPISTSVEIVIKDNSVYKVEEHTYFCKEGTHEKKTIIHEEKLENDTVLKELSCIDFQQFKKDYTNNDAYIFSRWSLEYNNEFQILGTEDQMPKDMEKILNILQFQQSLEKLSSEMDEDLEPIISRRNQLRLLIEDAFLQIQLLPKDSMFTIEQLIKDYNLDDDEKLELCDQVLSNCKFKRIIIEDALKNETERPWNILRIRR